MIGHDGGDLEYVHAHERHDFEDLDYEHERQRRHEAELRHAGGYHGKTTHYEQASRQDDQREQRQD